MPEGKSGIIMLLTSSSRMVGVGVIQEHDEAQSNSSSDKDLDKHHGIKVVNRFKTRMVR